MQIPPLARRLGGYSLVRCRAYSAVLLNQMSPWEKHNPSFFKWLVKTHGKMLKDDRNMRMKKWLLTSRVPLHLPTKINGHEILRENFPYWVHFAIEAMLSRTKNQIICMYFDSGHGNYMISAQFISQAHFPEKKFRLRLSIVIICHNKLSIRKFQSVHT